DFQRQQAGFPRVREAIATDGGGLAERYRAAGAAWPPRLFLRAFKLEGELEIWAAPQHGERYVRVRAVPICAASGVLGPKRRQGDFQVPEGFYRIDRYNPQSQFHLSLGIDYPNAVDRARAKAGHPLGGDIFIHGDCVTIGCLPLGNRPMEGVYLAAVAARDGGQRQIPVHIFPCRFDTQTCQDALAKAGAMRPADAITWPMLMPAYAFFERQGVPPRTRARSNGTYSIAPGRIAPVRRILDVHLP
ncbi:MAG: L,D-transpeptidase family protein, partial [Myxococcales bacterium]|nr:L,D-transpeptidase family protein [Myxococcales bacterium]